MLYGALSWLLSVNPNLNYTAGGFNLANSKILLPLVRCFMTEALKRCSAIKIC